MVPDEWQHLILEDWLRRDARDKWASGNCGLAVPRQNGKNAVLEIRELYGMVALGEAILHTAHEVKTARKAFRRLRHFFGDKVDDPHANFPELNALVKELRSTNGQEAIYLTNGGSIEFVARSRGSARGFTVDVVVLDEAQELTDEQLEALNPTKSAGPLGNPQTILTGTPPALLSQGEVFTRRRRAALDGTAKRACWHEWSVTSRDVEYRDPKVWAFANPGYGIRLLTDAIEDELPPNMSVDGFLRERLGMWLDDLLEEDGPFPAGTWQAGVVADSVIADDSPLVYAVDTSVDRSRSYIGVAGLRTDGIPQFEVAASRAGVTWLAEWFEKRAKEVPMTVVGQGRGAPVSSVLDDLARVENVTVMKLQGSDLGNATGVLFDLVRESGMKERDGAEPVRAGVVHLPQPVLDQAAKKAVVKLLDSGAMVLDRRRSPVDVAPLMTMAGALWGLMRDHNAEPVTSVYESRGVLSI